jgi:CyaY protein
VLQRAFLAATGHAERCQHSTPQQKWMQQTTSAAGYTELNSFAHDFILLSAAMTTSPLTDAQYRELTDAVLARIEATVDRWLEDDVVDIDTHRTGGLLELSMPGQSKLIINTQPPLHELWLAARGGGFHFKFAQGAWRDTRDGVEFFARLSEHASAQARRPLSF